MDYEKLGMYHLSSHNECFFAVAVEINMAAYAILKFPIRITIFKGVLKKLKKEVLINNLSVISYVKNKRN